MQACAENMTSPSPQVDFGGGDGGGSGGSLTDTFTPDVGHLRLRELKSFLNSQRSVLPTTVLRLPPWSGLPVQIRRPLLRPHPALSPGSISPGRPLLLLGAMSSLGPGSPQPPGLPILCGPLTLCQLLSFSAQFLTTGLPSGILSLPTCSSTPGD